MSRKDLFYLVGLVVVAALLLANLLRPGTPFAYGMPEGAPPASISATGDSAWVLMGNKVYYFTLRSPTDVPNRTINQIDSREIRP